MSARDDLRRRQAERLGVDLDLEDRLDRAVDICLAEAGKPGTNFKQVGPDAKKKLRGLMKHYASKPHPFAACVRDNRKRFGDRAENVCAVLKDLIRGTTKWRAGGKHDKGAKGLKMAEAQGAPPFYLDDELADLIEAIPDAALARAADILEGAA